ncbi:hypothetical protein LXL04_035096 [Taraxacum kok-saghyz]
MRGWTVEGGGACYGGGRKRRRIRGMEIYVSIVSIGVVVDVCKMVLGMVTRGRVVHNQRDAATAPNVGDRVPYVIIKGAKSAKNKRREGGDWLPDSGAGGSLSPDAREIGGERRSRENSGDRVEIEGKRSNHVRTRLIRNQSKNGFRSRSVESRSFENSYIPENPRTPKPLTFPKNRLRGAKNRSNISPVAKKNFRKNDFFFSKNFAYVQIFFLCICAQSLYNTYLKRFVKKNLKKNAKKKKLHICTKNKKKLHICKTNFIHSKRFGGFRSRFFERNNGLGDIGNWGSSRSRSFENSYIPENPKTSKPLTFSKNRLRGTKNRSNTSPVAKKKLQKNDFFFFQKLCICAKKKKFAHMHILNFCLKNA